MTLGLQNSGFAQPFCLSSKFGVKGIKLFALLTECEMHGIGKIQSLLMPLESLRNQDRVGQMYIRQSKELGKRATNCIRSKIVGVSEYPFGFQNNGIRYEDIGLSNNVSAFLNCFLSSPVRKGTNMFVSTAIMKSPFNALLNGLLHIVKGFCFACVSKAGAYIFDFRFFKRYLGLQKHSITAINHNQFLSRLPAMSCTKWLRYNHLTFA